MRSRRLVKTAAGLWTFENGGDGWWYFVGGPPLTARWIGSIQKGHNGYDSHGAVCSVKLPVGGTFVAESAATGIPSTQNDWLTSSQVLKPDLSTLIDGSDNESVINSGPTNMAETNGGATRVLDAPAGHLIATATKYSAGGGSANVYRMHLIVTPQRVRF